MFKTLVVSITLPLLTQITQAATDITGNWVGNANGSEFFCTSGTPSQLNSNIEFDFDNQNNNQFNVHFINIDASTSNFFNGIGTFISDTEIIANNLTSVNSELSYNLQGNFNGTTFVFSGVGASDRCNFSLGGTADRVIGIINLPIIITPLPLPFDEVGNLQPQFAGASDIVMDNVLLERLVVHTNLVVNDHIQNTLRGKQGFRMKGRQNTHLLIDSSGLAAGDNLSGLGIWLSYDYSRFDNNFFRTKYQGDTNSTLVGVDYVFSENMLAGIALGYEKTNIDTDFNLGKAKTTGLTFSPYFGWLINQTWGMDINLGYSRLNTEQYRTNAGLRINSDLDSIRWFAGMNLNGSWQIQQWLLSAQMGILTGSNKNEHFTESNGIQRKSNTSKVTKLSLGGEVSYSIGAFEPFFSLTFNHDTKVTNQRLSLGAQPTIDRNDNLAGLGFHYFSQQGLSVTLEYSQRFNHKDIGEDNLTLTGRWDY